MIKWAMLILGIETSCDETSMSVLEVDKEEKARILSNVISSQVKIHTKYGGVYPALAAREHAKNIDNVLKLALMQGHGKYKIIGETVDDAAGECFDKIARILDLSYPGGPLISAEAEKFNKSEIRPTLDPRLLAREFSSGCISDLPQIKLPRP